MIKFKPWVAVALAICMMLGMATMDAQASTRKRIPSVSLSFTANIMVDAPINQDEVEVESTSQRFTVDSWEFLNDEFRWEETSVPKLKVTLFANDGYYFSVPRENFTLKGAGATYDTSNTEDFSRTLYLTVTLSPLSQIVGPVSSLELSGAKATWEPGVNAGSYEIKLLRDGNPIGTAKEATSSSYDFTTAMTKAGTYSFRVRPVNKANPEIKGQWEESNSIYVDAQMAAQNRQALQESAVEGGRWVQDNVGWRYLDEKGVALANSWELIHGKWYYFDATSYMKTGWIQVGDKWYYCNPDGSMMANGVTPDGYVVGPDGAWIPGA